MLFGQICLANEALEIGIYDYPPVSYKGVKDKGYCNEIVSAVFKKGNFKVKTNFSTPARALTNTQNNKLDGICTINKDIAKLYNLKISMRPNANVIIKAWTRENSNFRYKGISSLKNKRIVSIRGYNYSSASVKLQNYLEMNPDKNITYVSSVDAIPRAVKMIERNRADILFLDKDHVEYYLKKLNKLSKLKSVGLVGKVIPSYFAISSSHPKQKKIMEIYNKNFEILWNDGTIKRILNKYQIQD